MNLFVFKTGDVTASLNPDVADGDEQKPCCLIACSATCHQFGSWPAFKSSSSSSDRAEENSGPHLNAESVAGPVNRDDILFSCS